MNWSFSSVRMIVLQCWKVVSLKDEVSSARELSFSGIGWFFSLAMLSQTVSIYEKENSVKENREPKIFYFRAQPLSSSIYLILCLSCLKISKMKYYPSSLFLQESVVTPRKCRENMRVHRNCCCIKFACRIKKLKLELTLLVVTGFDWCWANDTVMAPVVILYGNQIMLCQQKYESKRRCFIFQHNGTALAAEYFFPL